MPDSDDGEEEINDLDEFLNTIDDIERDDTLVDLLGQGYDVAASGDQDVADMLGTWRDEIDTEPVRNLIEPALGGHHSPGGTMSISDDAEALRAIGVPTGALQQALLDLDSVLEQASQLLGSNGAGLSIIEQAVGQAKQAVSTAFEQVQAVTNALQDAANKHQGG